MSESVAVIDVGSNSIKLLIAALDSEKKVHTQFTETVETRISEGISQELPYLTKDSMQKGIATIIDLVRIAREYKPAHLKMVATSAVRDAINGLDFIDAVEESTGIEMQVLSGTEEAVYIGKGLACDPSIEGSKDFIQVDIGGGSLELIRLSGAGIDQAISLRLGAVRMSERFIHDRNKAISRNVEIAISAFVSAELTQSGFSFQPESVPIIATGGAFVVTRAILAARAQRSIEDYTGSLQLADFECLKNELCALPLRERMATPHLPAARADIIPTALITILALLKHAGRTQVTHSFYNLRYGVASELLR